MYKSAINMLEGISRPLKEHDMDKQSSQIARHIKMEEELISELEDKISLVDNRKVKLLLNVILKDEREHHKLLKSIESTIIRGETITEQDWWEALWKDVPGLWI
jgi:rubrerythrin